jgi:hypothetical protein
MFGCNERPPSFQRIITGSVYECRSIVVVGNLINAGTWMYRPRVCGEASTEDVLFHFGALEFFARGGCSEDWFEFGFIFNVPSLQCKSNSAAIRAARYELIILQVWLSGASSWFRCSNASGMWQCARAEVPHEAERLWVIHWFCSGIRARALMRVSTQYISGFKGLIACMPDVGSAIDARLLGNPSDLH